MTFKEQCKFFITPYHSGVFNLYMHAWSGVIHYVAFSSHDIWMVVLAFGIEEIGHWGDYFFRFNKEDKRKSIEILPFKIICCVIFVIIMAKVFNWY